MEILNGFFTLVANVSLLFVRENGAFVLRLITERDWVMTIDVAVVVAAVVIRPRAREDGRRGGWSVKIL